MQAELYCMIVHPSVFSGSSLDFMQRLLLQHMYTLGYFVSNH